MQKWSNLDISGLEKLNDNLSALIEFEICYAFLLGKTFPTLHPIFFKRNVASLSLIYSYFHAKFSDKLYSLVPSTRPLYQHATSMDVECLAFPPSSNICEVESHIDASLNAIMFSSSVKRPSLSLLILISNPQKVAFESCIGWTLA